MSKCIDADPILRRECAGVFAVNKMPKPDGFPFAFVTNIEPDTLPGSHWVAIYMDKDGQTEFFDSYGRNPETRQIVLYLKKHGRNLRCNTEELQGPFSSACGQFCIYYLYHRLRNHSIEKITGRFTPKNFKSNDVIVTQWLNTMFDLNTNAYEFDFMINQFSKSLQ
ncbi:MAG: hypothetical protein GY696_11935 [Gammaproteobacteria bacterium]|nr:hypothetical protein [Gammaproteobacteria bacterium]